MTGERDFEQLFEKFEEIYIERSALRYYNGKGTFGYRQVIGRGNFGIVYRAQATSSGELDLCVKVTLQSARQLFNLSSI